MHIFGGVGWDVITFVHMNTCLMLRNSWGWGGMGCDNICSHEHMFDATQQLGLGWDGM